MPDKNKTSRERIHDCVLAEIERNGIVGMRLIDVAEAAGVSLALLHKHFGDRENLLAVVLSRAIEEIIVSAGNAQTTLTSSPQSTTVTIADTTAPTVTLAAVAASSASGTITFTVTGNEIVKGSFNMYAYGRDNPSGGTCTGNSYNFSNSATTRLTVGAQQTAPTTTTTTVAIATTVPTTVPTTVATSTSIDLFRPLGGPSTEGTLPTATSPPRIENILRTEQPITISPIVRSVKIPAATIKTLFDSISPMYINSAMLIIRANDGKWKTVLAKDLKATNIVLTDKSQRIEIQLIVEGSDPIVYNVELNRVVLNSSNNSNPFLPVALGAVVFLLLWSIYFLIVMKRRKSVEH